jgi:hypothetical protein
MSEKKERVFAEGFSFRKPNPEAPEYVVGRLSLKVDDAIDFVNKHKNANGWINLSIMIGRSGNPYLELDTYEPKKDGEPTEAKPKAKSKPAPQPEPEVDEDDGQDLPF